jgi:polyhydroxyalkanoate synthesis repressor PhaR
MSTETPTGGGKRVIKRYSNRKLYDTRDSRYVTLQQIGEMVRRGEDVQIIDNKTKEDKTEVTLALILSEDLKSEPRAVPLGTLRTLLQERSEKFLSSLREGPIGRLIPGGDKAGEKPIEEVAPEPPPEVAAAATDDKERMSAKARINELVEQSRQTLDQLQAALDERVQAAIPGLGLVRGFRAELAALGKRLEAIEKHLGLPEGGSEGENKNDSK